MASTQRFDIRRVQWNDPRLAALHLATFPSDKFPEFALGQWWMVFHEGIPVAFAGIQPSKQWCDTAYLSRCGVLPKYRGKGLQKRLLSVREKYARAQNLNWLITNTYKNIPSANALIRKGFKMYEPANPWGCRGTLYWLKKVSS